MHYCVLHPRSKVDRLPRSEGGRGLPSVEDTVNLAKLGLQGYVKMSDERLISTARGADEVKDWGAAIESKNDFKKRRKLERQNNWKAKMLHGQFVRQTEKSSKQPTMDVVNGWHVEQGDRNIDNGSSRTGNQN